MKNKTLVPLCQLSPSAFLLPTPNTPATTTSSTALRHRRPSPTLTLRQRHPSPAPPSVFVKMAKSKQKQPPNDFEECVQDGWVIVKKQKVTILIPPLPLFTQQSSMPIPGGSPLQPIAIQEVDDHIAPSQPDPPMPLPLPLPLSLVTTKPITTFSNPRRLMNHRGKLVNSHYKIPKPKKYCGNLVNGHMLVNTKMRALNLERKLKRAGGLNSWLVSLGLGQFVKIFRCKRVGKMQLVNLTMKKLKDMGAVAVGPRRKLMHAIDCLW